MEPNQMLRLDNEMAVIEWAKTDEQAFTVLYDFYFPKIYYFILKRVGHKETAEDIVSTIFLKVFGGLKNFKAEHELSFKAWLYRVAANALTDHYRRQGKRSEIDLAGISEPIDERSDQASLAAVSADSALIRRLMLKLKARDREILELKFFAEMSNLEIAATLNLSANHAGVSLCRALKKFKIIYEQYVK